MLTIKKVTAGYGKTMILRHVEIDANAGEIVAVIGRNGVGKTTLIKSIIGLIKPSNGDIYFQSQKITHQSAHRRARSGIGYVPQGRGIFSKLTVEENLGVGKLINSDNLDTKQTPTYTIFNYFPRLSERRNQRAGTMSGGEQSMLAISRALVGKPSLLLLDEPSEGVQPNIVSQIGNIITQINSELGLTVLLVEQNIDLIQHIAHRCYVMEKGSIVANLDRSQIADQALLVKYLAI